MASSRGKRRDEEKQQWSVVAISSRSEKQSRINRKIVTVLSKELFFLGRT